MVMIAQHTQYAPGHSSSAHHNQEPAYWGHRVIQWIDSYFRLCGPGNQPLWLTVIKITSYATLIIPAVLLGVHCALLSMHPFIHLPSVALKTDTIATQAILIEPRKPAILAPFKPQIKYINPPLLFPGLELQDEEIEINFAKVLCDGDFHLIPVERPYKNRIQGINEYARYRETALMALLKMAQNSQIDSPVKRVLLHPHNHLLTIQEFFNFLMDPMQSKRHLETLSTISLEETLELAFEQNLVSHDDLAFIFARFAGSGKTKIIKMLLDKDPELVKYHDKKDQLLFVDIVLNGHREEAEVHWQALQKTGKDYPRYHWLYKAMTNDCNFTKQEFQAIPSEWQQDMFQAANVHKQYEMIDKLLRFSVAPEDFIYPLYQRIDQRAVDLFSTQYHAGVVRESLVNLMILFKLDHLLVTKQQFDKTDHSHFLLSHKTLSSLYVSNKIYWLNQQLTLDPNIKTPKTIAIMKPKDPTATSVTFKVKGMYLTSEDFEIYEEIITPIERKATKDEMKALLALIDKTEFHGYPSEHFLLGKNTEGEEGIYFINTDYQDFERLDFSMGEDQIPKHVDYDKMGSLTDLIAPENHAWLEEEIARHREIIAEKEHYLTKIQDTRYQCRMAMKHGFGVERNFEITIKRIFHDNG